MPIVLVLSKVRFIWNSVRIIQSEISKQAVVEKFKLLALTLFNLTSHHCCGLVSKMKVKQKGPL